MGPLDQVRASNLNIKSTSYLAVGDEPIVLDTSAFSPPVQKHWIVESFSAIVHAAVRGITTQGDIPVSGLFLCPPGAPTETTSALAADFTIDARPIQLPCCLRSVALGAAGVAPFALSLVMAPGFKITVPSGWFLRAIFANAGTATPGPGAGSRALAQVLFSIENDCAN